jgi:hypothetical protein
MASAPQAYIIVDGSEFVLSNFIGPTAKGYLDKPLVHLGVGKIRGLRLPPKDSTVEDFCQLVGSSRLVTALQISEEREIIIDWAGWSAYFGTGPSGRTTLELNAVSFDVQGTALAGVVRLPHFIQQLCVTGFLAAGSSKRGRKTGESSGSSSSSNKAAPPSEAGGSTSSSKGVGDGVLGGEGSPSTSASVTNSTTCSSPSRAGRRAESPSTSASATTSTTCSSSTRAARPSSGAPEPFGAGAAAPEPDSDSEEEEEEEEGEGEEEPPWEPSSVLGYHGGAAHSIMALRLESSSNGRFESTVGFGRQRPVVDASLALPKVQFYCSMMTTGCVADFMVPFGGAATFYSITRGKLAIYMVRPSRDNMLAFEKWVAGDNRAREFFGDMAVGCSKVELRAGESCYVPSGWIVAVLAMEDSIVFGSSFLSPWTLDRHLAAYALERRLATPERFRFPRFEAHLWALLRTALHRGLEAEADAAGGAGVVAGASAARIAPDAVLRQQLAALVHALSELEQMRASLSADGEGDPEPSSRQPADLAEVRALRWAAECFSAELKEHRMAAATAQLVSSWRGAVVCERNARAASALLSSPSDASLLMMGSPMSAAAAERARSQQLLAAGSAYLPGGLLHGLSAGGSLLELNAAVNELRAEGTLGLLSLSAALGGLPSAAPSLLGLGLGLGLSGTGAGAGAGAGAKPARRRSRNKPAAVEPDPDGLRAGGKKQRKQRSGSGTGTGTGTGEVKRGATSAALAPQAAGGGDPASRASATGVPAPLDLGAPLPLPIQAPLPDSDKSPAATDVLCVKCSGYFSKKGHGPHLAKCNGTLRHGVSMEMGVNTSHKLSCHRCYNIRRKSFLCTACPNVFCKMCLEKLKGEFGNEAFQHGCPFCKHLCCCAQPDKAIPCLRKNHCYRKCTTGDMVRKAASQALAAAHEHGAS